MAMKRMVLLLSSRVDHERPPSHHEKHIILEKENTRQRVTSHRFVPIGRWCYFCNKRQSTLREQTASVRVLLSIKLSKLGYQILDPNFFYSVKNQS